MNNNITKTDNSGLFNSIRHLDDNGNEYWFGRELMLALGYVQWRRFAGVIKRATESLEGLGVLKTAHIQHLPGVVSGEGHFGDNYKLSRLTCYLIAMTGDSRKPEIASAQIYFAAKTFSIEILENKAIEQEPEIEPHPYELKPQDHQNSIFGLTMFDLECLHLHALMMALKIPANKRLLQHVDPIFHDMPLDAIKSQQWYRQLSQKEHLLDPRIEYQKVLFAQVGNTSIEQEIERLTKEVEGERDSYRYACVEENEAAASFSSKVTRRFTMRRTKALREATNNLIG
jgi:hypothetical protein